MAIGQDWYAQQKYTQYPLLPDATAVDRHGREFPTELLRDLKIRFAGPDDATAHVAEIDVTPRAVVILIKNANELLGIFKINRTPSAANPAVVRITSVVKDVFGYAVMADVTGLPPTRWVFDGPEQSGLLATAATPTIPILSDARVSREGFVPITGPRIFLAGDVDVEVLVANRLLDGEVRESVVMRLNAAAVVSNDGQTSISQYQVGCGGRPESGTCGEETIQTINRVPPDCCGRIYVELQGCGNLRGILNGHGAELDCPIEPDELCPPARLPDNDGRLPVALPQQSPECETTTELDSQNLG